MRLSNVLCWWCMAGLAAGGEPPPALTPAERQSALTALQAHYALPAAVTREALDEAALSGLLQAHPDTMQLVIVPDTPRAPFPLLSASLAPGIACLRPAAFRQEDVAPLREALTKLTSALGAGTLILDLRAPAPDSNPAVAAAVAGFFLPKDTPLFSLSSSLKTSADPVWTGGLMVLIDRDTGNTSEILAAVLKEKRRAFLVGSTTRGRTAAITDLPVRKVDGGQLVLRFTAQRAVFATQSDPFGKGVVPDLSAPYEPETKPSVFARQAKQGLAAAVFQPSRPHHNEASLVARTNPELPERIARTAARPAEPDAVLIDRPLQRAVDIIIANNVLEKPKP